MSEVHFENSLAQLQILVGLIARAVWCVLFVLFVFPIKLALTPFALAFKAYKWAWSW